MDGIVGMAEISLECELNRSQRENWLLVQSLARSLLLIIDDLSDISKRRCNRKHFSAHLLTNVRTVETGRMVLELDFLRLQQVLTNLVRNAIVFTSTGKKGHVSLSCRRLALDHSTVTLEVCVSDNGIGIAKDKLSGISSAFATADCSTIRVRATSYLFLIQQT